MLPFRPPGSGMPVIPGIGGSNLPPPRGPPPPGFIPGMMAMRGPPPRGPPPVGFPPGRGLPPQGMMMMMMPRGPVPAPSNTPVGRIEVDHAAPVELGSITLFVGKLPTELKDSHIRNLLEKCGNVESWRRMIDPVTSKPKAFGFCTYANAMDAQRALRLLNGFSIDSTQIVVKADNKTQTKMDEQASAMPDVTLRGELQRDEELRRELKSLEDERKKREGRIPNDTKTSDKFVEKHAKKTSTEEEDEIETPATTQGDASDDQEGAGEVQAQEKMIQSAIEKFRSSQNQREQTVNDKNLATAHESARHANEEQRTAPEEPKSDLEPQLLEKPVEATSNAEPHTPQSTKTASTADQNKHIAPDEVNVVEIPTSNVGDHTHERNERENEREKRDRREERKRGRSRSRSQSRRRSHRRRRSRSYSRSRSRSRGRERESRRDRKRDRESDRRRRRRRNSSAVDEEIDVERRTKRRRDSRSDDLEPGAPRTEQPAAAEPVAAVKVVMDLKMSLGTAKREKTLSGSAPSLFKVEDVVESKPVRDFVRIDFAEEERRANALAQQKAAETAAKINRRAVDVKTLIDSIPTDKMGLFAFPIDWVAAEKHHVIKNKMQSWVTKKVLEYLGEEDATLISFILNKLQSQAKPDDILGELHAILEDDAEVFVKSLWRKLAFEALHAGA